MQGEADKVQEWYTFIQLIMLREDNPQQILNSFLSKKDNSGKVVRHEPTGLLLLEKDGRLGLSADQ